MSADMRSQAHFRFLDLPCELRLMVYEWLKVMNTVYRFQDAVVAKQTIRDDRTKGDTQNVPPMENDCGIHDFRGVLQASTSLPPVAVILPCFSTCIIQTCKIIHREATPVIATKLSQLEQEPVRVMVDLAMLQEDSIEPIKALRLISELCMPLLQHTSRVRQAPTEEPHIVFTLINGSQSNIEHVRLAATVLIAIFEVAHREGAFCTVLCEEMSPLPQFRTYAAILATMRNHPESPLSDDQELETYLRLRELNEKEWAEHRAFWECWL
ncbi:hypothetical protein BKA63DRAFT_312790 [Paraphoma chrysanthemicola]|nr:hypothetical protein BKA63DRAFT_312790 [Paraphoma chrysanthemicola]